MLFYHLGVSLFQDSLIAYERLKLSDGERANPLLGFIAFNAELPFLAVPAYQVYTLIQNGTYMEIALGDPWNFENKIWSLVPLVMVASDVMTPVVYLGEILSWKMLDPGFV